MSRNEKINKLGNAIREYRGTYNPVTLKWKRQPKPHLADRLLRWLERLGVDEPIVALADIQEFKDFDQMRDWLSKLNDRHS